ncbi:oxidase cueO precursor [Halenospora varia]|nr:oxidase cueO precursor [Halenospora varia]
MRWSSLLLSATTFWGAVNAGIDPWQSPEYKYIFQYPLPIPPVLPPSTTYTNTSTGKTIDFYEINIQAFDKQTYPNLGVTSYVGYNGIAPGPTLKMTKGREAVVRFVNSYNRPSSIHLHGSYSRTPFDGWAEDVTNPGQYKDYYYPNAQPVRTLWYHDHAIGITAVNAYFGQAGFYILEDQAVSDKLKLPTGDYDIPLMLASKQFLPSGKLLSPENERVSLYGDVNTVNGQPWPYLNVENRKYKFRLLDASISRSYSLYLVADSAPNTKIPFTVVGADAGYLDHPVVTSTLDIAMAERYEIVIDFDKYKNQNLTLKNARDFQTNPDYPATDRVLRFVVGDKVSSSEGNGDIASHLGDLAIPPSRTTIDQEFTFERTNGEWLINGIGFENIKNRVVAYPPQGKVQRWRLINKSGGWSHPIHIHLIDFQVVKRSGSGRSGVMPYEAAALKDVVYLGTNEEVEVIANFAPWSGVYMFHCHNLVHEDHDMMAAFNVSQVDLSTFGYPEKVSFNDPMAPLFRAKSFSGTDLNQVRDVLLPYFQNIDAYPDADSVLKALDDYYKNPPSTSKTTTSSSASTVVTVPTSSTLVTSTTKKSTTTTSSAATSTTCNSGGKGKSTC